MGIHTPTRDLSVRAISLYISRIAYLKSSRLGVELIRARAYPEIRRTGLPPAPPCAAVRGHAPQNAGLDDFPGGGIVFVRKVLLSGSSFLIISYNIAIFSDGK